MMYITKVQKNDLNSFIYNNFKQQYYFSTESDSAYENDFSRMQQMSFYHIISFYSSYSNEIIMVKYK